MGKIFPDHPLKNTKSNAERKVFYSLKDLLSDEYTILHSVPVYRRSSKGSRLVDGELDFLLIHPDKGFIVIEVKGGGILRDSFTGQWKSVGADGQEHNIKDPYEQGKEYSFAILGDLKKQNTTLSFNYPVSHAAWFPDINVKGRDLGISVELSGITLDKNDLGKTATSIPSLFKTCLGDKNNLTPGIMGVKALCDYLAPSWEIRISLSSVIKAEQKIVYEATRSQYRILSLLQRHNRALICGAAGTGKTFIALEKAKRIIESNEGKKVLLVCFNVRLSEKLKELVNFTSNIDVFHFHGLCVAMCQKSNIPIPQPDPIGPPETYFKHELPEALLDALCQVDDRYDALIVDEGQDFDSSWWMPLSETLKNPNDDIFYIFYDDNQMLYNRNINFPIHKDSFFLHENCRNTKRIYEETLNYYKGDIRPEPIGPEGRSPQIIKVHSSEEERKELSEIISQLVKKEKVKPNDITVLTPCKEDNSIWSDGDEIANCKFSWNYRGDNSIYCSTIHSFKGLESPIVIVTETNKIPVQSREELLYVSLSRAVSHLVIIQHIQSI